MRNLFKFGLAAAVALLAGGFALPALAQYSVPDHDTPYDQPQQRADQDTPEQVQQQQQQYQQQRDQQNQQVQDNFNAGQPPAGSGGSDPAVQWQAQPALPASRNPMLGRWRYVGMSADNLGAQQANMFSGLLGPQYAQMAQSMAAGMYGSTCESLFKGGSAGLVEFRAGDMVAVNNDGSVAEISRVDYRSDGASVIVLPKDLAMANIFAFDVNGGQATARALGCTLQRAGATTTAAASTGGQASLVINAAVRIPGPGRNFAPVAGAPLLLSTRSLDEALAANPAAKGATDAQGHLTFAQIPTGHFYVIALGGTVAGETWIWSVPVDIAPGSNELSLSGFNSLVMPAN